MDGATGLAKLCAGGIRGIGGAGDREIMFGVASTEIEACNLHVHMTHADALSHAFCA